MDTVRNLNLFKIHKKSSASSNSQTLDVASSPITTKPVDSDRASISSDHTKMHNNESAGGVISTDHTIPSVDDILASTAMKEINSCATPGSLTEDAILVTKTGEADEKATSIDVTTGDARNDDITAKNIDVSGTFHGVDITHSGTPAVTHDQHSDETPAESAASGSGSTSNGDTTKQSVDGSDETSLKIDTSVRPTTKPTGEKRVRIRLNVRLTKSIQIRDRDTKDPLAEQSTSASSSDAQSNERTQESSEQLRQDETVSAPPEEVKLEPLLVDLDKDDVFLWKFRLPKADTAATQAESHVSRTVETLHRNAEVSITPPKDVPATTAISRTEPETALPKGLECVPHAEEPNATSIMDMDLSKESIPLPPPIPTISIDIDADEDIWLEAFVDSISNTSDNAAGPEGEDGDHMRSVDDDDSQVCSLQFSDKEVLCLRMGVAGGAFDEDGGHTDLDKGSGKIVEALANPDGKTEINVSAADVADNAVPRHRWRIPKGHLVTVKVVLKDPIPQETSENATAGNIGVDKPISVNSKVGGIDDGVGDPIDKYDGTSTLRKPLGNYAPSDEDSPI